MSAASSFGFCWGGVLDCGGTVWIFRGHFLFPRGSLGLSEEGFGVSRASFELSRPGLRCLKLGFSPLGARLEYLRLAWVVGSMVPVLCGLDWIVLSRLLSGLSGDVLF